MKGRSVMIKPMIKLKWRPEIPYERLDVFIAPLAVFASACAIAADYNNWFSLLVSIAFTITLLLLVRFRSSKSTSYILSGIALLLLLVVFPDVPLYGFLLILYPLLLMFALIDTNPRIPFAAGLLSSLFLFRFQSQISAAELWANIFAILLNTLVYSLLTYMMRKLLKERNEYKHLSMIDSLTGLSSLQQTWLLGQQLIDRGNKVRVLLIDLDHFKHINDTYGHMVGNKVIVHFANSLRKMVEGVDGIVGRLGGDEFVIIMEDQPNTSTLIERIEQRLNHSRYVPGSGLEPLVLSFSIGEAVSDPKVTTDIEQLMHLADLNMYAFKLRNRVPIIHNQSEQLFENNPDPICTFDNQGILLDMNPAAEQLLGYTAAELKERSFSTLILERDRELAVTAFETHTLNGSPTNYEITVVLRNGTEIPVHVTNIPIIANNKIAGFYTLAKDMSEQKKAEELKRQTEKLEAISRIAARFSEEMRGPLKVLSGFTQLLMDQKGEGLPYYAVMQKELERLVFISNEFNLLSKPTIEPTECRNPVLLLHEAIGMLESKALLAQIDWEVTALTEIPEIVCDSMQLKHAFVHVLSNAIEAMPQGGRIHIEFEHLVNVVVIRVRDQGGGMEEQQLSRVGEPYYSSKPNGVGIGLMITLRIMQNHQGTLFLCHDPHSGTTVELKLPG